MESSRICAFLFSCILAVLLTGPQIFPVQGTSSTSTATLQSTTPVAATSNLNPTTVAATSNLGTTSVTATSNLGTTSVAATSNLGTTSVAATSNLGTTSVAATSNLGTTSVAATSNLGTTSVAATSNLGTTSVAATSNLGTTSVAASSSTSTNKSTAVTASVTTVTIASVTSMATTTAVKSSTISGHSSSSAERFSTGSSGTLGTSTTIISGSTSSYATSAATPTTPSQLTSTTPTTVAVSSSTSSHLPAPDISISETNLLLASDSFFVELQVNTGSLEGITLEIFDASSTDVVQKVSFNKSDTSFSVADLTNATLSQLKSVALILYSGPNATNRLVLDKLIFMRSDGQVDASINETFTNQTTKYITIVNEEILVGLSNNISLSRCWSGNNNSDTFIVTQMTKNEINNCTRSGHDIQLYLTSLSSTPCEEISKNLAVLEDVKLWVAKQINAQCHCGMTPHLLEDTRPKCTNKPSDLLLTLNITGAFPKQVELFVKAYQESIQKNTDTIATQSMSFTVVKCTQECSHDDPEQNDNGKYSVTVAVVLSCIAVFSIIFIAVIVYMKRKRRGLLQFRMTRLAEDDDDLIGDMEDFVGSSENHEPSFRNDSS